MFDNLGGYKMQNKKRPKILIFFIRQGCQDDMNLWIRDTEILKPFQRVDFKDKSYKNSLHQQINNKRYLMPSSTRREK